MVLQIIHRNKEKLHPVLENSRTLTIKMILTTSPMAGFIWHRTHQLFRDEVEAGRLTWAVELWQWLIGDAAAPGHS